MAALLSIKGHSIGCKAKLMAVQAIGLSLHIVSLASLIINLLGINKLLRGLAVRLPSLIRKQLHYSKVCLSTLAIPPRCQLGVGA